MRFGHTSSEERRRERKRDEREREKQIEEKTPLVVHAGIGFLTPLGDKADRVLQTMKKRKGEGSNSARDRLPGNQYPKQKENHLVRVLASPEYEVRDREAYKNTKHLCDQPPVARDSRPVAQQFLLRALDVVYDVLAVVCQSCGRGVDANPGTYVLASMR